VKKIGSASEESVVVHEKLKKMVYTTNFVRRVANKTKHPVPVLVSPRVDEVTLFIRLEDTE
jgi:hypothetical protein